MTEIALITGANRGLGLAIAECLGRQGVTVIIGARDRERGQTAAARLRADGLDAESVALDLTDASGVRAARDDIGARHDHIDILVNNAGVLPEASAGTRVQLDVEMFRTTFGTNVLGTVAVTEAFLPLLLRSVAGRIVNVSSALGSLTLQTDPDWRSYRQVVPAYQASKSALNAITIALAKLLETESIKVNSVCPGFVQTEIHPPENRSHATLTTAEAGEFVARVALDSDGPTGQFIDRDGVLPW